MLMKLPSNIHPMQPLRGLRTLALAVLTLCAIHAEATVNLISNSDFSQGLGGLEGWTTTLSPTTSSTCCSASESFVVSTPGEAYGPFDGSGPFNIDFNHAITLGGNAYSAATLAFHWHNEFEGSFSGQPRVFSVQIVDSSDGVAATLYTVAVTSQDGPWSGDVNLDVAAALNALPAGNYTFRFDSFIPQNYSGPGSMRISALSLIVESGHQVLFTKGDAVPGVSGKNFTTFGSPAINDSGAVAFLGKWPGGGGIVANGVVVSKLGDVISGSSTIVYMKDPVIDDAGHVTFICTLAGPDITTANNCAVLSNAFTPQVSIVAQEGMPVQGGPVGALWKTFSSVVMPGGGGMIILGYMAEGSGGITSANDNGVWSADPSGHFTLVLQEGTTNIGGKTVKNFSVLKAVSGTFGQARSFNSVGELVSQVTFSTGAQAIVRTMLP